ncbi:permease [Flavobacterium akiainvivens]|uniref:Permease n=1 Tax=Flavobacterium akiainvivens TaxID=1202724 RepID=A0A0N0RQP6_9FLAO|nr:DMT family transporter [Flavobacterium akiainvivens]KOS06306.1 permease [Flavobacterium akiainvivens]SFQ16729.1 Threonine/homoserine efflux transporter RhtA [Flavobacterium akiainvivens]
MGNRDILKGTVLVGLGAASYGLLATFVKLAYAEKYTTAEVTGSQMLLGLMGVGLLYVFQKSKKQEVAVATPKNKVSLIVSGTSIGFTSVFYYLSLMYITVPVGIVLLMQSVWMGIALESLVAKTMPGTRKLLAALVVIGGTVLATNLLDSNALPDWRGIGWGLGAAVSYTMTMYAGNSVALGLMPSQRALYMLMGGAVVVGVFTAITWPGHFDFSILISWGLPLALFGTILPPLLMNAGFPKISLGLGTIVSSLELPVSVTMAWLVLNETVGATQWLGIGLILGAIVLMNVSGKKG